MTTRPLLPHYLFLSSHTCAPQRKSNGVQLPFPKPSHRWCVLGVDLRDALRGYTSSPYACIRAITMCSWLTVRTMFTSDYRFNLTVSRWERMGAQNGKAVVAAGWGTYRVLHASVVRPVLAWHDLHGVCMAAV